MYIGKIKRFLTVFVVAVIVFGSGSLVTYNNGNSYISLDNAVYAESSSVKSYRSKITKNRKYIEKKVKVYKGLSHYLSKAKSLEKKSKETSSISTLKSYNKKVASYAKKIKKTAKQKKKRVSWYKAPNIAAKKSIKWTSIKKGCNKLLGIKYKWGGTTKSGFDCSGFVSYVLDKNYGLPYTRYTSATAKSKWGNSKYEVYDSAVDGDLMQAIDDDRVRPGDILVHTRNGKAYHVSIFAGHDDWGPVQYDSFGEITLRYVRTDRRIQAFRGVYTKSSTSKQIAKYRNAISASCEQGVDKAESSMNDYESVSDQLESIESSYHGIEVLAEIREQANILSQAKVIYDESITLGESIRTDWKSMEIAGNTLYELQSKARSSRKPSTIKKYITQATAQKQIIDSIDPRLNNNSTKLKSNVELMKSLYAQVEEM